MTKLDEIEERVDLNYLINPGDLGMFSNTPSRKVAVADMRLLIHAVRQLGNERNAIEENDPDIYAESPAIVDPDVLELIAYLEQGVNEQD